MNVLNNHKIDFDEISKKIKYKFFNKKLLVSALTHPSFDNKNFIDYERLEFLGDSVLSLAVTEYLYHRFPDLDEGSLTIKRSELINKNILHQACEDLNLNNHLIVGQSIDYNNSKTMVKLMSNIYEAMIGAIYIDSKYLYAKRFIIFSLLKKSHKFSIIVNYKGKLLERCNELSINSPNYEIIKSEGPDHTKKFTIQLSIKGHEKIIETGYSIKEAEKRAAKRGLELINLHW